MKLTDWFPAHINPVRSGVYEIQTPWPSKTFAHFSAEHIRWSPGAVTKRRAREYSQLSSVYQSRTWRGIAK